MIKTSRQLKDLIHNLARKNAAERTASHAELHDGALSGARLALTVQGKFYLEGRDAGRGHGGAGYTLHHGH